MFTIMILNYMKRTFLKPKKYIERITKKVQVASYNAIKVIVRKTKKPQSIEVQYAIGQSAGLEIERGKLCYQ